MCGRTLHKQGNGKIKIRENFQFVEYKILGRRIYKARK
jgi:hypothetical protein